MIISLIRLESFIICFQPQLMQTCTFYFFFLFMMHDYTARSNSEPSSDQQNNQDGNAPLWRYFTREAKLGKGEVNIAFQCNLCRQTYRGLYYRVKAHLLGCLLLYTSSVLVGCSVVAFPF